jgi:drug/metabolite transporter (DMT)-like permease
MAGVEGGGRDKMTSESKEYLDLKAILIMVVLTSIWGFNYIAVKFSNQGMAPIFTSAIRSVIASACGVILCLWRGERLFHTGIMLFHGFMVGLLFGGEFACIYFGLLYTDVARSVVLVYMSPFVTAIGAHFFLKGDRLTVLKSVGLGLAFLGIVFVFGGKPKSAKETMVVGDVLQLLAAVFWGATTVYIKRFMAGKVEVIHTFLYQLIFSIPILFAVSFILETRWIMRIDTMILASLFYQSFIQGFLSLMVWFRLIHGYSVSRLSAFTFFTPIFGTLFGVLLLGEEFTFSLMVGLPLVCAGIFLVNWKRASA